MTERWAADYGAETEEEASKDILIPINIYCEDKSLVTRTVAMMNFYLCTYFDASMDSMECLEEEKVTVDLLCGWGAFLLTQKNKKGEPLKQSACMKYLSCLVSTVLIKKFPKCSLFTQSGGWGSKEWYTRLREKISRKAATNSIDAGLAVVDKPYAIGPKMAKKIIHVLLRQGTHDEIRNA